ncbi:MAG: hypothetical protein HOD97_03845 [Candidatus Marinimicrobia bacterium]|jgi:hypothetical protein|nr:hypothetical protein [Candidatus Neomarinimicrobiota bacterium]MBT3617753.1 hypothetical protein [Candidatus Neomarinimicrobiota bacterium]MBT3828372.1 hypothetical protein [Candidatus Neomarinimicrobiota bacterium]MBT3997574.1 hypothetical protein [Candidatus Neomarinimicrobiota bacterium]MBT4280735.1 hypothetical protein [Candidatus Neomarinimicrobiota bacterium]
MEQQAKQNPKTDWLLFFKAYRRHFVVWALIGIIIFVSLKLGIDKKIIVFVTVILGVFTQVFVGLGGLIAAVPLIGPIIIKVLTIPFFWIVNAIGYFVGAVAIKKGYTSEFTKTRVLTLALLIGIIIGYILGHAIPLR